MVYVKRYLEKKKERRGREGGRVRERVRERERERGGGGGVLNYIFTKHLLFKHRTCTPRTTSTYLITPKQNTKKLITDRHPLHYGQTLIKGKLYPG